uniref:Uncharacterized protein n=1 Tax=Nelumbo nucifera TaxID=4432 RepID=A0A822YWI9_NELNU|nr:TPA_asm: hypothetical protein HUJ06_007521 [Nelumbo nucifera]
MALIYILNSSSHPSGNSCLLTVEHLQSCRFHGSQALADAMAPPWKSGTPVGCCGRLCSSSSSSISQRKLA